MEKYQKLLESTVAEDIALGLFLCSRDGLLKDQFYPTEAALGIAIQLDDWTIWNSRINGGLAIRKFPYKHAPDRGRFIGNDFDFRTKTEE